MRDVFKILAVFAITALAVFARSPAGSYWELSSGSVC